MKIVEVAFGGKIKGIGFNSADWHEFRNDGKRHPSHYMVVPRQSAQFLEGRANVEPISPELAKELGASGLHEDGISIAERASNFALIPAEPQG